MPERMLYRPKQEEHRNRNGDAKDTVRQILTAETAQDAVEIYHVVYPEETAKRKHVARKPAHPKRHGRNSHPQKRTK